MVINCDICCTKSRQSTQTLSSISTAQFIHLNKANKISLVCQQCLCRIDDEIFYLPIQSNLSTMGKPQNTNNFNSLSDKQLNLNKPPDKYLNRVTQNYGISNNAQLKKQIESMLKKQVFEPFTQLQKSLIAYKSTLNQYKKTVRSQFKAIMSKMDPSILQSFKQIVIQMHSQSINVQQKNKRSINVQQQTFQRPQLLNGQKEQFDTLINGMKISALNEWNQGQVLMQAVRKSYEKFRNVFRIQQEDLDKKSLLLKKIIAKITIQYQYDKIIDKQVSKYTKHINEGGQASNDKLGEEQDSDEVMEIVDNDNHENDEDAVMIISEDENDNDDDPVMIIEDDQQTGNKQRVQNKETGNKQVVENNVKNKSKRNNQDLNKNDKELKEQTYNKQQIEVYDQPIQITSHFSHNISQEVQNQPPSLSHHYHQSLQQSPLINTNRQNTTQPLIGTNNLKTKELTCISPSIEIDLEEDECFIDSISSNSQFNPHHKPMNSHNNKSHNNNNNITNSLSSSQITPAKPSSDCSIIKPPLSHPPITYEQYESFQISVENYMDPLKAIKQYYTTDFKIKKSLEKNKFILPIINTNNSTNPLLSPHDYAPYLKLIRRLKISYTRKKHLSQLLKLISQCTNLQSLTICQPLLASQQIIHFIISSFPLLTCLQFLCFNHLNQAHLNTIPHHLPQLQELYYGPKCFMNIALKSEYRQFRQHKKQKRTNSLPNLVLMDFMHNLPPLKNAWISQCKNMDVLLEFLSIRDNFQHLILGKYITDSSMLDISSQSWQQLTKLTNLHSLALLNIKIDTAALQIVLKNNSHTLKSLQIYACANWTDQLASLLKKCRSLKEFYLFNSDESIFKGHSLWDTVTLETLVLRSCQFMDKNAAQNKIGKLSQLRHIDLYGCEWFNDQILQQLVKNKYVTYLNLSNTEIASLFHESLRSLFKIRCLALGSTRINAAAIEQLCAEFPEMEKLSLYNLKGSAVFNGRCMVKKNRLNKIGDILKNLKYIDIGSLDTADDTMFDHFKNIKTIYLWMSTNLSQKKIKEIYLKGVNIVDDV